MSRQFDTYIHSLLEPDHRNAPLGGSPVHTHRKSWQQEFINKYGQEAFNERMMEQQEIDKIRREAMEGDGEC